MRHIFCVICNAIDKSIGDKYLNYSKLQACQLESATEPNREWERDTESERNIACTSNVDCTKQTNVCYWSTSAQSRSIAEEDAEAERRTGWNFYINFCHFSLCSRHSFGDKHTHTTHSSIQSDSQTQMMLEIVVTTIHWFHSFVVFDLLLRNQFVVECIYT